MALPACIALFCACCSKSGTPSSSNETSGTAAAVSAVVIEYEKFSPRIESFGSITYAAKIDVTPQAGGTIDRIYVREGDYVRKGDLLADLVNVQLTIQLRQSETAVSEAEAALALTQAAFTKGRMEVEARILQIEKSTIGISLQKEKLAALEERRRRQEKLYDLDGVSEEELENSKRACRNASVELHNLLMNLQILKIGYRDKDLKYSGCSTPVEAENRFEQIVELNTRTLAAEVEAARSRLASAKKARLSARLLVQELSVTAPAGGIIGGRYYEPGERSSGKETLFTIFTGGRVYAAFPVQEADSYSCKKGQEVIITVPSLAEKKLLGRIELLSPTVEPSSGNVMIKASIPDKNRNLKPGMFIRAVILTGKSRQVLFVPATSVINQSEGLGTVFTVSGGRAFPCRVALGCEREGKIEVIRGLEAGTLVIDSPPPLLQEGEYVEIVE